MYPHLTSTHILQGPTSYKYPHLTSTYILQVPTSYKHLHLTSAYIIHVPTSYKHPHLTSTDILQAPTSYKYPHLTSTYILQVPTSYKYLHLTSTYILQVPTSYKYLHLISIYADNGTMRERERNGNVPVVQRKDEKRIALFKVNEREKEEEESLIDHRTSGDPFDKHSAAAEANKVWQNFFSSSEKTIFGDAADSWSQCHQQILP